MMRWVAAGEGRAVASVATARLRQRIAALVPEADRALAVEECLEVLAQKRPQWPLRDLGELMQGLERARFAPAVPGDIAILADRVDMLLQSLAVESGNGGGGRTVRVYTKSRPRGEGFPSAHFPAGTNF